MKYILVIVILFLASCQKQKEDPMQKYGFCSKNYVVVGGEAMILSGYTMQNFKLKNGQEVDRKMLGALVQSEIQCIELMMLEMQLK